MSSRCGCCSGLLSTCRDCFLEPKTEHQNNTLIKKNLYRAQIKLILPSFQCYSADRNPERIFPGHWKLMYADLPLTDYDIKWLTGSLTVLRWLAHNPFSLSRRHKRAALSDPNGWTLDSATACKNLNAQMPVQFLSPCLAAESLIHLLFPSESPNVTCNENRQQN